MDKHTSLLAKYINDILQSFDPARSKTKSEKKIIIS
jgi:hypothetical protein